MARFAPLVLVVAIALLCAPTAYAVNFTVNDLGDAGDNTCDVVSCTLRDAVDDANATGVADVIRFDGLAGTITTAATISATQPVTIDGTTGLGYVAGGPPVIQLDGNGAPIPAISLAVGASTVRALSIYEYGTSQVDLIAPSSTVESSWIGVRPNGTTDPATGRGVRAADDNQVIGGTAANTGNLIAGTATAGIDVINGAQNVQIKRNFIGTNPAGTVASANNGTAGILLTDADSTIIGGSTADGNVVSGFSIAGVHLGDAGNSGNTVRGNLIGTNAAGTGAIPNVNGVALGGPASVIGGATASDRNVISGNTSAGITFTNTGVNHNQTTVYGNYIGTDITGATALPNGTGVRVTQGGTVFGQNPSIGATGAGQGNVISGNSGDGVEFQAGGQDRELVNVSGNLIGVAADGTSALGNGGDGVDIDGTVSDNSENNQVSFNTISANVQNAVRVRGTSSGNAIQGNQIGVVAGGNGGGVSIEGAASSNQVGGLGTGQGNTMTLNGGGVSIIGTGTGNSVRANSIYSNVFLGIAFNGTEPFPNDALDADTGANNLQNHPVLTSVTKTNTGAVVVQGNLDTTAGTQDLDAYWSPACDSSGFGEGAHYIGSGTVVTAGTGPQAGGFTVTDPLSSPPIGSAITATTTSASGTSEFSACHTLTAAPAGGGGPAPPPAASSQAPKPTVAKTTNVGRVSGKVLVKVRGSSKFVELRGDQLIPIGSQVDARNGRARVSVEVESAKVQSAVFYDGLFKINQKKARRPVAEMQLVGKLENCAKKSKRASASARKRRGRRLWGNGKGRFRTRGKRSSALVRGTIWMVEDRCDGSTLTQVRRGTVTVRDFGRRKNVTVKKGKRYVAKARGQRRK